MAILNLWKIEDWVIEGLIRSKTKVLCLISFELSISSEDAQLLSTSVILTTWHARTSNTFFGWSSRKLLGRFFQNYQPSMSDEVLIFSFDRLRLPHLISFLIFTRVASFSMLLMEVRLRLYENWLSPLFTSHDYPSFAIIFNRLFFVLRFLCHDPLLESNMYRFKSPKLDQVFPLIIKVCWWRNTWSHLNCNMICLSYFIHI